MRSLNLWLILYDAVAHVTRAAAEEVFSASLNANAFILTAKMKTSRSNVLNVT